VAYVARSIHLEEPVGTIFDKWTRFEKVAPWRVRGVGMRAHFRGEVLTFKSRGSATFMTLRVEYDAPREDPWMIRRVERTLEWFRTYLEKIAAGEPVAS
jgi:hypothetical protein